MLDTKHGNNFLEHKKETKSCKKTQILIISENFTNFQMKGIELIWWDVKYVDSSRGVKYVDSSKDVKYVDSSRVKIYANLMVWWRSFGHSKSGEM
jgi:hypothetical protein